MERSSEKCVMVVDESLPLGIAANVAAILGITLGKRRPEMVGEDVADGDGGVHAGIITVPVPVLKGNGETLRELWERLRRPEFRDLAAVDFSDLAQGCRTYGEYREKMAAAREEELRWLGLAVCGARKKVDRLTGSLPLLR